MKPPGCLFVLSAPSGAGKTTLVNALRQRVPDLGYSISYTTRPARSGEQDGVDYHFISENDFRERIAGGFWAEWARVHDHFYGTAKNDLSNALKGGRSILMDIDVQGTLQILRVFPEAVAIFIMPPSPEVLGQRLRERGADSEAEISKRLANAVGEMRMRHVYRHIVVNEEIDRTASELVQIVEAYLRQRA